MFSKLFKPKNTQRVGRLTLTSLAPRYTVTGQITVADVADIKAAGFDTVMCNRPDGEESGQPSANQIKRAVEKAGMKFFYVPMGRSQVPGTAEAFKAAVSEENGKVFAYCRTGNRSSILWKNAQ